jgi:hypothetical protein
MRIKLVLEITLHLLVIEKEEFLRREKTKTNYKYYAYFNFKYLLCCRKVIKLVIIHWYLYINEILFLKFILKFK